MCIDCVHTKIYSTHYFPQVILLWKLRHNSKHFREGGNISLVKFKSFEFKSVNSRLTWIGKAEMLIKLLNIIQKLPKQFEVCMLQRGWPSWTAGCGWTTWTNHIFIDTIKEVEKACYLDSLAVLQPIKGWCCIQRSMYKRFAMYAVLMHIYGTARNQVFVREILSLFSWNLVCKKCRKLDWTYRADLIRFNLIGLSEWRSRRWFFLVFCVR